MPSEHGGRTASGAVLPSEGAAGWLRLLASSASSRELREHREELLGHVRSAAQRAELEEEAALAAQIHSTLIALAQRAEQTEALSELASRLVSLTDIDEVLHEVVRQARRLVGADVSYLTLPQPPPDAHLCRIRGLDGAVSATFRDLAIPVEIGAAGRAYVTGLPYCVSDYFADGAISHSRETDDAVAHEGIVAKLAAPLRLGSQVIGTLIVAQRRRRVFTAADIATVSAFAAHAALAISKARLVTDLSLSVSRLNQANAELLAERHQIKRILAFHEELNRVTHVEGGGVPEIVALLGRTTELEAAFFDAHDAVLASHPLRGQPARLVELARGGGFPSRHLGALRGTGCLSLDAGPSWHVTLVLVASRKEHFGVIALAAEQPMGETAMLLAERAALVAAVVLSSQRAARETETRRRLEILGELLGADRDDHALRRRARLIGLDEGTPKVVAAFGKVTSARVLADITATAGSMGGLAGHQGGVFVAVVSSDNLQAVRAEFKKIVARDARDAVVGLAGPAAGLHALSELFADARRCAALLQTLGRYGELATPADLSFYRFLFTEASNENLAVFIEKTIGGLMTYDHEHSTDLVRTLSAYLDCGRHHAETSRRLNIHHNTLHQRLRRIDEVIGSEWRHPLRSLELHVAMHVHHLMAAPGASG